MFPTVPAPAATFPAPFDTQPMTLPLSSPSNALAGLRLPEGFSASLFAAEPDIQNPIALATDEKGRLWVAENYTYAERSTGFDLRLRDRIVVLEDTNHDGRFDRRTVFWDGAQRLTSVEVGFGGVWALCPPNLYFIPDRNRDLIPDGPPQVILDGWNAETVQHTIANGLRWGPDGWLYGRHGILANSRVGRPGTPEAGRTLLNCAIWRYHPTRHTFEVVAQGTTNPWGMDWDEHGEGFFINTVIGHLWHLIPGAHYRRMYGEDLTPHVYELIDQHADHYHWDTVEVWSEVRKGLSTNTLSRGGGHAHSGLMFQLGDTWPAAYRNSLFTVNLHGRRLNRDTVTREGSGYVGRHAPDFAFWNDPWFRGVELIAGPRGDVYVADWTDIGECHEADGVHRNSGRIYRIAWGSQTGPTRVGPRQPDLGALTDLQLVELQLDPDEWHARQARRLLQERAATGPAGATTAAGGAGAKPTPAQARLRRLFTQEKAIPRKLRLLWALSATGGATPTWLTEQLAHPDEHVRSWAVRLLADAGDPGELASRRLTQLATGEPSALVRLHLASTLQRLPATRRAPLAAALLAHAEDASDHNLPLLIWYGIEPIAAAAPDELARLLPGCPMPKVRQFMARRLAEQLDSNPGPVTTLLKSMAGKDSAVLVDVAAGLSRGLQGWRSARKPDGWDEFVREADQSSSMALLELVQELNLSFGDPQALAALRELASNSAAGPDSRRHAVSQLITARRPDLPQFLIQMLADPVVGPVAARGLASRDDSNIVRQVIHELPKFNAADREAVVSALVSRPSSADAFLDALETKQLGRRDLSAFNARTIRSHGNGRLDIRLANLWGDVRGVTADKARTLERFRSSLTPARLEAGNPARGRELFKVACAVCHKLNGEGAEIGPDLTGANRDNLEYLLENILDPNASVAADFKVSVVTLKDDRVLTGVKGSPTEKTFTLQTQSERLTVAWEDVAKIETSMNSLMPEGLLESLKEEEARDLIRYLMTVAR